MNSLYVHIPFCQKKCFYCSFVVSIGQEKRIDEYIDCLGQEAGKLKGTKIDSIHLGGGTPSLLKNQQLQKLGNVIKNNFVLETQNEFTIEINPENLDPSKAQTLKSMGINRVSLGVQSFQDECLEYLGRNHDSASALKGFAVLRDAGFKNINIDLIYALANQNIFVLEQDLDQLKSLGCEHASLYTLTVEEQSRFFAKKVPEMQGEMQAEFFKKAVLILEKAGLMQYEVSNFAKSGFESIHNMNYWRGGDYIGLGVGAHSHKAGYRWWNVGRLTEYMKRINEHGSAKEGEERLSPQERLCEAIVFGLRMNEGIELTDLEKKYRVELGHEKKKKVGFFVKKGFLVFVAGRLQTTLKGRLVLDEISSYLV